MRRSQYRIQNSIRLNFALRFREHCLRFSADVFLLLLLPPLLITLNSFVFRGNSLIQKLIFVCLQFCGFIVSFLYIDNDFFNFEKKNIFFRSKILEFCLANLGKPPYLKCIYYDQIGDGNSSSSIFSPIFKEKAINEKSKYFYAKLH